MKIVIDHAHSYVFNIDTCFWLARKAILISLALDQYSKLNDPHNLFEDGKCIPNPNDYAYLIFAALTINSFQCYQ